MRTWRWALTALLAGRLAAQTAGSDGHFVTLASGDDDRAAAEWIDAINRDCSAHVVGRIPAGTLTLRTQAFLRIRSECATPGRTVEIVGRGIDSTVLRIASRINGGGGFAFIVQDPRVHIHAMTIIGDADTLVADRGDGNSGIAIAFRTPGAALGEADSLRIENFAISGVDIYRAPGVFVHDLTVACAPVTGPAQQHAMGIWGREIRGDSPGSPSARISRNRIANCGAEAIPIADARNVNVADNVITCPADHCVIGIALYAEKLPTCDAMPVSDNIVSGNTIDANGHIGNGIVMQGSGSGHANRIEHNTIRGPTRHGIVIAATSCAGGPASAFSDNIVVGNDIADARDTQIWSGGAQTLIQGNRTHPGSGMHNIADVSRSSIVRDNVSY
jgi:hypothetical protein